MAHDRQEMIAPVLQHCRPVLNNVREDQTVRQAIASIGGDTWTMTASDTDRLPDTDDDVLAM